MVIWSTNFGIWDTKSSYLNEAKRGEMNPVKMMLIKADRVDLLKSIILKILKKYLLANEVLDERHDKSSLPCFLLSSLKETTDLEVHSEIFLSNFHSKSYQRSRLNLAPKENDIGTRAIGSFCTSSLGQQTLVCLRCPESLETIRLIVR